MARAKIWDVQEVAVVTEQSAAPVDADEYARLVARILERRVTKNSKGAVS